MRAFLLRRALYSLLVLLGVSTVVFVLIHLSGDPAELLLPPSATRDEVIAFRQAMGFNRPLAVQYGDFMVHALQGDYGESLRHRVPAMGLVLDRLPATVTLMVGGMLVSLAVAVPLGVLAAVKRNSWLDYTAMVVALAGQSMPSFWLGIVLILVVSVLLGWLPPSGIGTWRHLVLPSITLGAFSAALVTRLLRSALVEVLRKDYIRTARAKGLAEKVVLLRHAFRNAAIPVVTIVALQVGHLMAGAVITENVFAYPGISQLAVQAIANRDFPVVQAYVVIVATIILIINLCTDMTYVLLDPRVRVD